MNPPVKVRVEWTSEKLRRLPCGGTYSTVAKFAEDGINWPVQAWSIVLEFSPDSACSRSFSATARFLVSNGPVERLRSGAVFELFEGRMHSATVTVQ